MKDKRFGVVLVLQAIILVFLIAGLFKEKQCIELEASSFNGIGEYKGDAWYIDESYGEQETFLTSEGVSVPVGVYNVQLYYETDTNMSNHCGVSDPLAALKGIKSNGEALYAGLNSTDYDVWVMDGNGLLSVTVSYGGQGTLTVMGARIYNTGAMQRMTLLMAVVLFAMVDLLYVYYRNQKDKQTFPEKKVIAAALAAIVVFSSYPLWTDYLRAGGDLGFHLLRIEGVKDGLLAGQFPVRIAPEWQHGHGYASSIFYGDTLLYIPALLRIIGFSIQASYKIFLLLLNAATCIISYYAFAQMLKNRTIGVLCSMLYTMSVYRLFKLYYTGGVGETIALMFLPLLLVGMYKIFTDDINDKKYYWNWVLPCIGFCGTIQSHILTTYIAAIFVILLCVIMWKKVFRKETFLVLSMTVIFTTIICAWFIVPFFDYMSEGTFVINNVSGRKIQDRGIQGAQLLKVFFNAGGNSHYYANGMVDAEPEGMGSTLLMGTMLFLGLCWSGYIQKMDSKLVKTGKIAVLLAVVSMAMSTLHFPWDRIQRLSSITATLVSSIQYPTRFLCVATLLMVLVTGIAGVCIWHSNNEAWKMGFLVSILACFLTSNMFMLNEMCDTPAFFRLYNVGGMGTGYISGAEYLPVGTDASVLWYNDVVAGEAVRISAYEKESLSAEISCVNVSKAESYVEVPILYYDGYRAKSDTGERLTVCPGDNNVVRVILPGDFEGNVSVSFVSPWYWRAAEVVSVVFSLGLIAVWFRSRRKEKVLCVELQS